MGRPLKDDRDVLIAADMIHSTGTNTSWVSIIKQALAWRKRAITDTDVDRIRNKIENRPRLPRGWRFWLGPQSYLEAPPMKATAKGEADLKIEKIPAKHRD